MQSSLYPNSKPRSSHTPRIVYIVLIATALLLCLHTLNYKYLNAQSFWSLRFTGKRSVAILMSGQVRTFSHCNESFWNHVIVPNLHSHEFYIFVHVTYSNNENEMLGVGMLKEMNNLSRIRAESMSKWESQTLVTSFLEATDNFMKQSPWTGDPSRLVHKDKDLYLKQKKNSKHNLVLDQKARMFVDRSFRNQKDKATLSMFLGISKAYELMQEYLQRSTKLINFDLIIRTRPDLLWKKPLDLNLVQNPDSVYLPWFHEEGALAFDQFAVGYAGVMKQYADVFRGTAVPMILNNKEIQPERTMYEHLKETLGLNLDIIPCDYALCRYNDKKQSLFEDDPYAKLRKAFPIYFDQDQDT